MRLLELSVYRHRGEDADPVRIAITQDLGFMSMLYRSNVAEFMRFGGKTATRNTRPGLRQTIELPEHGFQCHVYVRGDGLAGVAIADKEYPARPVFSLLTRLLEDYEKEAGKAWRDAPKDCNDAPQFMKDQLKKYQNPQEADKLMKIQKDLDEIKEIMHKNIDEILKRGETLDQLVEKSEEMSASSVHFYKQSKKVNSCCKWLY